MVKRMTKEKAMEVLASIIINDPSDIRIGFSDEDTARLAADALSTIKNETWLVSTYRPRWHSSQETFFCYRVTKVMPATFSYYESEDEI